MFFKQEYTPIRVLALDPGTSTMGVSLMEVFEDEMYINVSYSRTHDASKMLKRYPRLLERTDELTTRLHAHQVNLLKLINWLEPDVIVAESPFFNPRRPSSSEPLARMKQILVEVAIEKDLPLEWIAPQQMKKAIGAKMGKGTDAKKEIEKAVQHLIDEKRIVLDNHQGLSSLEDIDEHSIDSVGVGFAYALGLFLNYAGRN